MMITRTSTIVLFMAIAVGFLIAGLAMFTTDWITQHDNQSATTTSTESGKQLFQNRCSSCHAIDINEGAGFGPNLAKIGAEASTRVAGMTRVQYILDSIVNPASYKPPGAMGHMPKGTLAGVSLSRAKELVSYVATLGANQPSDEELATLDFTPGMFELEKTENADLATLQKGQSLFLEKLGCNGCHTIFNNPGQALFAPSLGHAASLSSEYIVESLRTPSAAITSGYNNYKVQLKDGTEITGLLVTENSDSITLLFRPANGAAPTRVINRTDIKKINISNTSSMPPYELSESDETALVAFLRSLKAHVPDL